jgi:hypothetical protein
MSIRTIYISLMGVMVGVLLAACGGGGSSSGSSAPLSAVNNVTQSLAKAMSANTLIVPREAGGAVAAALNAARTVVEGVQATQSFTCAGGGTASFSFALGSSGTPAQLVNGQLDAGERYVFTFNNCKDAGSPATLSGVMSLEVMSAGVGSVTVNTVMTNLAVTTEHGSVALNGSSMLQQSTSTSGTSTTVTNHWTSPSFSVTTAFNGRTSVFTFTNIDITQTVTTTSGVVTDSTYTGSSTLSAALPSNAFNIITATTSTVTYDVNGNPTSGSWTITLPNNRITLTLANNTARVDVDYGADGTIDATYTFTIVELVIDAG